jgi:hypothetical protein
MEKLNNFVRDLKEILESKKFMALDKMDDYPEGDENWESLRSEAEAYDGALKAINSLLTQYNES